LAKLVRRRIANAKIAGSSPAPVSTDLERQKDKQMKRRLVFSDGHFGHDSIYKFTNERGRRLRPWADNAQEGDEIMIQAWNSVVRQQDTVYHLGDVAMRVGGIALMSRLNGRKVLIRGNHDIFPLKKYTPYFADVRGTHKQGSMIFSHYPLHPESIPHWCLANVHGHTHANIVKRRTWYGRRVADTRYFNACVEVAGVAPIEIEDLEARIKARQKA
jgi:calcineurin-like phosphoesterase family protein